MHHRFNIFREEVIQKYLKAKDFWYRSVFLNLFSIHCQFLIDFPFIFIVVTLCSFFPDMSGNIEVHHISMVSYGFKELLTWKDLIGQMIVILQHAKRFFDNYVTAWNPCEIHRHNIMVPRSLNDDPYLLNTDQIFSCNPHNDYEELLNCVQRHTKCSVDSYLCKNGTIRACWYNAPWDLSKESRLFIDDQGRKKYDPTRNDDRLNVHNIDLLKMCRENFDCQPVLSQHVVVKYISKYASKVEKRS